MTEHISIREVGLRDGLQNIKTVVPTELKLAWIKAEAAAGVKEIEVCSFVPPKLLPQFADAEAVVQGALKVPGLTVSGLMCLPPANEPPAPHFALTAKIARRNEVNLLSMGMSTDFPAAVGLGATHVRIGTAIFGERN